MESGQAGFRCKYLTMILELKTSWGQQNLTSETLCWQTRAKSQFGSILKIAPLVQFKYHLSSCLSPLNGQRKNLLKALDLRGFLNLIETSGSLSRGSSELLTQMGMLWNKS